MFLAWQRWRASGYKDFPSYAEVAHEDPAWVTDVLLVEEIYRWTHPPETPPPKG